MNQPFRITDAQRQMFARALNPNAPSFLPINANPNATYANPYAGQANPQSGNLGMGGGGPNRYDYTQAGSGLWSIGIDRSSPTAINDSLRWYQSQNPSVRAEIGAMGGLNVNDPVGLLNTIDQRQRDVARKITKTNGFMDSTLGQLLGIGLPMAAGGLLGPLGAIGASAAVGGATGGLKGAALGALGSAVAPAIKLPGLGNALRAPAQAASSVARQFANPLNASRQLASVGIGRLNGRNA